jgi:hypothetical protein
MTEVFSPEELKIMRDDSMNVPAKAAALEKLRQTMAANPYTSPDWTSNPENAARLRKMVSDLRSISSAIVSSDAETEKHREKLDLVRARIRSLEVPAEPPSDETATELARLKCFEIQMSNFLGGADARHAVLTSQIWAKVEALKQKLFELTARGHWPFADRNFNRPEHVHAACASEVERVLAGGKDKFDLLNASGQPDITARVPRQIFV